MYLEISLTKVDFTIDLEITSYKGNFKTSLSNFTSNPFRTYLII